MAGIFGGAFLCCRFGKRDSRQESDDSPVGLDAEGPHSSRRKNRLGAGFRNRPFAFAGQGRHRDEDRERP
jgi:hypothetical protein